MIVVDASIAVKWLVPEKGSDLAERLLVSGESVIAPDLVFSEVANTLATKNRRGDLTEAQALERIAALPALLSVTTSTQALAYTALKLSCTLGHPAYDCFYAALALRRRCPLITDDRRFRAVLHGTGSEEIEVLDLDGI